MISSKALTASKSLSTTVQKSFAGLTLANLVKLDDRTVPFLARVSAEVIKENYLRVLRFAIEGNTGFEGWWVTEIADKVRQKLNVTSDMGEGPLVAREVGILNEAAGGKGNLEEDTTNRSGIVDLVILMGMGKVGVAIEAILGEFKAGYRYIDGYGSSDKKNIKAVKKLLAPRMIADIEKAKRGLNSRGMNLTFGTNRKFIIIGVTPYKEELSGDWGEYGASIKYMEIKAAGSDIPMYLFYLEYVMEDGQFKLASKL